MSLLKNSVALANYNAKTDEKIQQMEVDNFKKKKTKNLIEVTPET